ncbi:MAG: DUF3592 domain-containing protein [Polaromonas sp.]|uniref:DUF3592 domain-containing protein n=1 Tax=Polaromonas sp. TaxID=1869339 RepID=UPI00326567E9
MRVHHQGKIVFKILGVLVGLVFIVFGFQERSEISGIQKRGKRVVVEPISKYTEFKKSGSSTYTAEFHFTTEDGRKITAKHSFPEEVLADFKSGKPVEIAYMPNDPSTFVFSSQRAPWTLVMIGAALLVAALVLL